MGATVLQPPRVQARGVRKEKPGQQERAGVVAVDQSWIGGASEVLEVQKVGQEHNGLIFASVFRDFLDTVELDARELVGESFSRMIGKDVLGIEKVYVESLLLGKEAEPILQKRDVYDWFRNQMNNI